jgi:hypothetical protein
MDQDTIDQARKIQDQLNESFRRGAKNVQVTADQVRILTKAYDHLADAAKTAAKQSRELHKELETVTVAFYNPADTFAGFLKDGVDSGNDLLKTFSAIAGLMFDEPLKKANDQLEKEKKTLDDLMKQRHEGIKIGDDAVKQLEEQLKKEKELCNKTTQCDDDKIRSLEKQIKSENDKVKSLKDDVSLNDDLVKKQKEEVEKAAQLAEKLKNVSDYAMKFIAHFADAFDRFVELDKAAASFRKELALGRDAARGLEQTALQLNQQFVTLGVTIDNAYKSLAAIGKTLGTSLLINKELATTTALLAANYGVSETNASGFLQKMSAIGGMTDQQASAMAGFTANLANAAGVNLDEVMQDVANASDDVLSMMRGNVKQMTFAAIQAKQLGVSLDKSASSAKGLLNFTQSVSDEMEASVLLGKNLNLNAARQLSFQGDVAGAQKEILNQVRQMGDINKMNVFQQEALAKATGYSVNELTKMLKNEEKLAQLSDEQRASYDKALESFKEQNEETGKQLLMQTQMQSAMAQLSNVFKGFKQILADILTPVVNVAVKLLIPALKVALLVFNLLLIPVKVLANALYKMWEPIEPIVQSISDAFDGMNGKIEVIVQSLTDFGVIALKANAIIMTVGRVFGQFWNPLDIVFKMVANRFAFIDTLATKLLGPIRGLISGFGSASGVVGKFASGFSSVGKVVGLLGAAGKAIPVIGWVITALQVVWGLFSRLWKGMGFFEALGETLYDVFISPIKMLADSLLNLLGLGTLSDLWANMVDGAKSFLSSIGSVLISGLTALGSILYKVYIQPWINAWNFISDLFVGKSNSTLGDGIIKGLVGVGSAILKIFTSPFETIFQLIMNGFSSIAAFVQNVLSVPFKIAGKLIGIDTGGIGGGAENTPKTQDSLVSAINETNQKLDTLINLMVNGGIAVNLDGRKVSEQLAIASS